MGSLEAMESIPSCLQSTQLIRRNEGTNMEKILAKYEEKSPSADGRASPTIDGTFLFVGELETKHLPPTVGHTSITYRPRDGNFCNRLFGREFCYAKPSIVEEAPKIKEIPHAKLELEEGVGTDVERETSNEDSCECMRE
ncbi:hypothetical protein M9H77_30513 [Catharanthus roseus]|uniref:Uncharacterized protein n=1 Tax=Catharanthus roseus TaxID=4058 RepID=A0ACC0A1D5_CATRO|nr:hypothetical protein M9H77_30513 [Catharanthus roseus]